MSATCKSCGAPIWWGITASTKKPIPMDPGVNPDGNFVILAGAGSTTIVAGFQALPGADRYQTHWATCPNSAQHRRRAP